VVHEGQLERLIFRAAASIVHSVAALSDAQRGELLPHIVRIMRRPPGGDDAP
jgi:hypothetical protein